MYTVGIKCINTDMSLFTQYFPLTLSYLSRVTKKNSYHSSYYEDLRNPIVSFEVLRDESIEYYDKWYRLNLIIDYNYYFLVVSFDRLKASNMYSTSYVVENTVYRGKNYDICFSGHITWHVEDDVVSELKRIFKKKLK